MRVALILAFALGASARTDGAQTAALQTWMEGEAHRHAPLPAPLGKGLGFVRLLPFETGIAFTNHLEDAAGAANRVLENGSGVAIGDFDADGWPDVFLCSLAGSNALFRNLGGWRFENVTRDAGLRVEGEVGRGAVFADLDGDALPDLLMSTLARGVLCFLNQGRGRFREAPLAAGGPAWPGTTTLALADIDGNGTLDLYVARYRAEDVRDNSNVQARVVGGRTVLHPRYEGRLVVGPSGLMEFGEIDLLLLNDGPARFRPVPWTSGAFRDENGRPLQAPPRDWGLSATFRDLDGDGDPDLYVCNDYWTPDRLWLNDGDGTFRAAPREALRHTSENSMGMDGADIDRDGHLDFLVLDMLSRDPVQRRRQAVAQTRMHPRFGEFMDRPQVMQNTLFHSRGDGTYAEIAHLAGLAASGWSWQPLFLDVDLDGYEDVVIPAGHRRDVQDLDATARIRSLQRPLSSSLTPEARQEAFTRLLLEHARLYPTLEMPVVAFRNQGDLQFQESSAAWGLDHLGVHQGMAAGDLDRDGDLDLVVNALNGPAGVYRNECTADRIAVRLRGATPNTQGIGARIVLRGDSSPPQMREILAGGRYLSGCEPIAVFAPCPGPKGMTLEVRWRRGAVSRLDDIRSGRIYEIREPTP